MKDKFMFFSNFKETADKLPDELRLKFYDAITNYVFNGTESDDPVINALITAIKPSLDKTDERGGVREGAGRKSKEIKNNQNKSNEIKVNQNNQSFQETETETETEIRNRNIEKEMDKEKVAKAPTFKKPTLDEVKAYCKERNNGVNAEQWIDHYTANGWKVGKNPMKDWKATVRTWERGEKTTQQDQEGSILVEDGKFYIDDTMPEYKDVLSGMSENAIERCWSWIFNNKNGQRVSKQWVIDRLNQFKQEAA